MQNTTPVGGRVPPPPDPEIERLAGEVAELRAENAANRAAQAVQAQLKGQDAPRAAGAARKQAQPAARRRLARRRPEGLGGADEPSARVSRRRLFGLLGGAAAVGTGLAVTGSAFVADPAGAMDGSNLVIGQSNTNTTGTTTLTGSTTFSMFTVDQTGSGSSAGVAIQGSNSSNLVGAVGVGGVIPANTAINQSAVFGSCTSTSGFGVTGWGLGANGIGVAARSTEGAALVLVDSMVAIPPTTAGTVWTTGSLVVTNGQLWLCNSGGTVGTSPEPTFVRMAPLVTLGSPVRVYDSRVGFLPSTGPKSPITTGTTVTLDVTINSGVPSTASAVLGNVTVTNSGNGYLTVYNGANGTPPGTSSINLVAGVTLANNFTSACNPSHNIKVTCGGPGPTDFIVDIVGYYP
jgi:hypothetical protein